MSLAEPPLRVLQLSSRAQEDLVPYCLLYEFENLIGSLFEVDWVVPDALPRQEKLRKVYRLARKCTGSPRMAAALTPRWGAVAPARDYDLLMVTITCNWNLYTLRALKDWRPRCRQAVCFVAEAWVNSLAHDYLLELLDSFDQVFVGLEHAVPALSRKTRAPCHYLPLATDVLGFAPQPDQARAIDLCNIGRRSTVTHPALTALCAERGWFYYHDTATRNGNYAFTVRANAVAEHRRLLANLLKRSRYFVANRASIDEPAKTGGVHEIPARYYEGMAAGTILLGDLPDTQSFRQLLHWPGAAVAMPFDCPDPAPIFDALEQNPEAIAALRRRNVREAALHHDWLHRLERIFAVLGLPATASMRERRRHLEALAARFS